MNKVLSIIGPTATGKTNFALQLNEVLGSDLDFLDLISADSRQVYHGMEVGTGADMPPRFQLSTQSDYFPYPFYTSGTTRFHGVSILEPTADWSVKHFHQFAQQVLQRSWSQQGFPVLVGGTGLYHLYALNEQTAHDVPPNEEVREKAMTMTTTQLQEWLENISPENLQQLNDSDRANPRRLIRAIERALATDASTTNSASSTLAAAHLIIGLRDTKENLIERIQQRLEERIAAGMYDEVQALMSKYSDEEWQLPAFSATGYKEVRSYLEGNLTETQMKELWLRREVQYAKRQMTWWKKQPNVQWVDVSQPEWQAQAVTTITNWLALYSGYEKVRQ